MNEQAVRGKHADKNGVTLIELAVVLAILAIFAGFALSVSADKRQIRAIAEQIRSDVRYARRIALTEGKTAEILFNTAENYYVIRTLENKAYTLVKTTYLGPYVTELYTNFPGMTLKYTPRGTLGGRSGTITVSNGTYTARLTVTVGAGRIEITDIIKKTGR